MNLFDDFNLDIVKITKSSGGISPLLCDSPDDGSGGGSVLATLSCVSNCVCPTDLCPTIDRCPTRDNCDPTDPNYSRKVCG